MIFSADEPMLTYHRCLLAFIINHVPENIFNSLGRLFTDWGYFSHFFKLKVSRNRASVVINGSKENCRNDVLHEESKLKGKNCHHWMALRNRNEFPLFPMAFFQVPFFVSSYSFRYTWVPAFMLPIKIKVIFLHQIIMERLVTIC